MIAQRTSRYAAIAVPILALAVGCASSTTIVKTGPLPIPSSSPQTVPVVPGQAVQLSANGVGATIEFSADASPSADSLTYVFSDTLPSAAPTALPSGVEGAGATVEPPYLTFSLSQTLTASAISVSWEETNPPPGPLYLALFDLTANPSKPILVGAASTASHARAPLSGNRKAASGGLTFPAGDVFFMSLYSGS